MWDIQLIRERWVRWFDEPFDTMSPAHDPTITDELNVWLLCSPPDDVPSRNEVEESIRMMAKPQGGGA